MRETKVIEELKGKINNDQVIKSIYLYNTFDGVSNGNYIYLTKINKKVCLLGLTNVLIRENLLKKFLLILKKFKFETVIVDIKQSSYNNIQINLDSFINTPYKSTNGSNMHLLHINLNKIKK